MQQLNEIIFITDRRSNRLMHHHWSHAFCNLSLLLRMIMQPTLGVILLFILSHPDKILYNVFDGPKITILLQEKKHLNQHRTFVEAQEHHTLTAGTL